MSKINEILEEINSRHLINNRENRKLISYQISESKRPYQGYFVLFYAGKITRISHNYDYLRALASRGFRTFGKTSLISEVVQIFD